MAHADPRTDLPAPGLVEHALAPAGAFWPRVAEALGVLPRLSDWIVLVPRGAHSALLRAALAERAVNQGLSALRLPRITTLAELARDQSVDRGAVRSESERRIELFGALKASDWLHAYLASGGQALWAMARQLIGICDELTLGLGAVGTRGASAPIEARILAAIKGTYRARAWEACSAEAQLVLDVWRATLSRDDGAALLLRGLESLVDRAPAPLAVVRDFAWLAHESSFYERYATRRRVECFELDVAAGLAAHPALAAAWPELSDGATEVLGQRAQRLAAHGRRLEHVRLGGCTGLEEQATRAAQQVLHWLSEGRQRIGVVALDRVVARRMRALLERAEVLVRDESGWKFSTTAVAGTLMRWLELASSDEAQCDTSVLLDWLKSPHVLSSLEDKQEVLAQIERASRRHQVLRDLGAIANALARESSSATSHMARHSGRAGALIAQLRRWVASRLARATLAAHFDWLDQVLTSTGMAASFANDIGGEQLLRTIADLRDEARRHGGTERLSFREWRDFLGDALENATFRDASITSPVSIVDLLGAALRDFDAVLLLGADAEHLPVRDPGALFLTPSLRAQLGLGQREEELHAQLSQLALLLAATPSVLITWQAIVNGEARGPANPLMRLSLTHEAAFGDSLSEPWTWPVVRYAAAPIRPPQPRAGNRIPLQVSASQYATLTHCPYQYYVRHVLQLSDLEELSEDVSQRDYGELVHRILQRFHGEATGDSRAAMVERLLRISNAVFDEVVGDNPAFLGYRRRWRSLVEPYVDWQIRRQDEGWQFEFAELESHAPLELEGGRSIELTGRLDRIDRGAQGLSIIDYKARPKAALRESLSAPGEDVQLPFYRLLQAAQVVASASYLSVDKDEVVEVGPPQSLELLSDALARRLRSDFTRLQDGAALPALGVEAVCQYCEARGLCRKGQWSELAGDAGTTAPGATR